jgi:hypothetical protein
MAEPPDPAAYSIADYIRANREALNREAIHEALRAAGHSDGDIDAAFAAIELETSRGAHPTAAAAAAALHSSKTDRQTLLQILTWVFAVITLLLGVPFLAAGRAAWYLVIYIAEVVAVAVIASRSIAGSAWLRSGSWLVTIGWLLLVPVLMLAIMGMCVTFTAGSYPI